MCPELLTIFRRFWEYHKRCTLLMLKSSTTWEPRRLYLDLLACQLKKKNSNKLKKSERWVVKWSSRNDGFEHKKRTGRPKILNEAAKRILNKAKYKRGNSTRQLSQQLASKGHVEGKNTIWRFMKSEGWRPLRRQKKNMLTAKQRETRRRRDNKQRRVCRILTFRIYVLSKAINVFMQKCSFDQCSKRNELFGHPAL